MKRILFIYPPSPTVLREDRCPVPSGNPLMSPLLPPTDLMYLASVAEAFGYECRIRDFSGLKEGMSLFADELKEFSPDMIVINMTSPTIHSDLFCCNVARSVLPDATIIAKGAHFLKYDKMVMDTVSEIDILIRGEAEFAFREILSGMSLDEIAGITWRKDKTIIRNPDRDHGLDDIDSLPFPARHLVNTDFYRRVDTGRPLGVIKVSRGCPYGCFFCLATPVYGEKVRMRSIESIILEIEDCVRRYGIKDFIFWSDLFNASKEWVMKLCSAISSERLKIKWSANIRADRFDMEMAFQMKKAGCELVSMGVESGSQEILDRIGKSIELSRYEMASEILRKTGIKSIAYYIFGFPWENIETAERTIEFSIAIDTDFANFYVAAALPGTPFYDYVIKEALAEEAELLNGALKRAYYSACCRGYYLNKDEINRLRSRAIRNFYLRPGYILKRFGRIQSIRELKAGLKAVTSLFTGSSTGNSVKFEK